MQGQTGPVERPRTAGGGSRRQAQVIVLFCARGNLSFYDPNGFIAFHVVSVICSCICRVTQHERYGALTLVNSTGADTGEFACYPMYCEDADCRREHDKAVKVFVFFPGTANELY